MTKLTKKIGVRIFSKLSLKDMNTIRNAVIESREEYDYMTNDGYDVRGFNSFELFNYLKSINIHINDDDVILYKNSRYILYDKKMEEILDDIRRHGAYSDMPKYNYSNYDECKLVYDRIDPDVVDRYNREFNTDIYQLKVVIETIDQFMKIPMKEMSKILLFLKEMSLMNKIDFDYDKYRDVSPLDLFKLAESYNFRIIYNMSSCNIVNIINIL